jgi:amidase
VRPASYCGIWGLKASLDGIDRGGVRHLKKSIDTLGVFARSLDDVALFMAGLTGASPRLEAPSKPRIGICRTPEWKDAEPATIEAIDRAKKALEKAGATIDEVEVPRGYEHAMGAFRVITTRENLKALLDEINRGEHTLNPWIRDGIAAARQVGPTDYEMANFGTGFYRQHFGKIFDTHDALLTPSANGEAPKGLEGATLGQFNSFWTWMYVPALNVPAYLGPSKMPVGVTMVGKQGEDMKLLSTARWVEKALGSLPIQLG